MDKKLIYYLCDRTACAKCDPDCKHTSNIAHAKNFTPTDAGFFVERIEEVPATPENIKFFGFDPAAGEDKMAVAIVGERSTNKRQNDCPFQLQVGNDWLCGKIPEVNVDCPDMTDFKACGDYPYKKRNAIFEEYARGIRGEK